MTSATEAVATGILLEMPVLPSKVTIGDSGPTFWRYASGRPKELEWENAAKVAADDLHRLLTTNESAALALLSSARKEIVLYSTGSDGLTVYIDEKGIEERGPIRMASSVPPGITSDSQCAAYLAATPIDGCVPHPKDLFVHVTHKLDQIARELIRAAEAGEVAAE